MDLLLALMSNHYHLVRKLAPDQRGDRSADEIMARWCALFKGPLLIQRYLQGGLLSTAESAAVSDIVYVWRNKLSSISWFMRCLSQLILESAP